MCIERSVHTLGLNGSEQTALMKAFYYKIQVLLL